MTDNQFEWCNNDFW